MNRNKSKKGNKISIKKTDVIIFTIIMVIFTTTLLSFFPGLITSDGVDQIEQARKNCYVNAHPILHSFLIGNLVKLGGLWVPALFQIIIFGVSWTYACRKIRNYNNSTKNKLFQIFLTFIICMIPLNFMYSITIWKDIIYTYTILGNITFIYVGIKEKFKFTSFETIMFSITCALIMKLRHNGVPIGFLMFSIIFLFHTINNKNLKKSLIMILSFVLALIVLTIPKWLWWNRGRQLNVGGVLDDVKFYCMASLINTDIELEDNEKEFLNKIYNIEKLKEIFNPYEGVEMFWNEEYHPEVFATEQGKKQLTEILIKYAKKDPVTVIKHFADLNSIWWSVEPKAHTHDVIFSNGSVSEMSNGEYDNHPLLKKMHDKILKYSLNTLEKPIIYILMYRPAVTLWISSLAIILVCFKKKNIEYVLILFPMILNLGTYVLVISSQDLRYFYPCFITEYFSLLVFAEAFIKEKKNNKEIPKNKKVKLPKNPKTLIIIPAYNESESIEKVVNSVYAQNITNCDVIVINDGSKDSTYEQAKKTRAIVIDAPNNLGIGGAVQTGYLYAKKNNYDIAIQIDGDGQHDPRYIKDLIEEIKKGNDLVIGSRFIEKTGYNQTASRMLGINIISLVTKLMSKVKIYDTTSGYRAANKNVIEEFAESYPYDYPEPCTNMSMIKKGYQIKEIPVEMKKRETGVSSISPLKAVIYMFKVTLSILLMGLKK